MVRAAVQHSAWRHSAARARLIGSFTLENAKTKRNLKDSLEMTGGANKEVVRIESFRLMVEAQQIGCFALSETINDVLGLPQGGPVGDATLDRINSMRWPKIPAKSGTYGVLEVSVVRVS